VPLQASAVRPLRPEGLASAFSDTAAGFAAASSGSFSILNQGFRFGFRKVSDRSDKLKLPAVTESFKRAQADLSTKRLRSGG
jgi:hypothetical protein